MTDAEPVLRVRDLRTVVRSGGRDVEVVRGVSFDVLPGQAVALVGESGSGKSMTALSVMGLLPSAARRAAGTVEVVGRETGGLRDDELRGLRGQEIAMVYQDAASALNPLMRVGAQVHETLVAHGVGKEAAQQRTLEVLTEVGLPAPERTARRYPHELSGGQRQRVMIAMAVALRPRLLIADEPTTALDVTIQQQVLSLVDELRRETGLSLVWITHDLGVVARVAEHVVVMYAGEVVESGPSADLFARPQHPYTAGLLGSVPTMRGDDRPPLRQIDGSPPDVMSVPPGCPFHPRCPQRVDRCVHDHPPLEPRDSSMAACWVPPDRWVS